MPARSTRLTTLLLACACGGVGAQEVVLSGVSNGRALLVVDGGAPRFLSTGQTLGGVRVLSVGSDSAVVEVGGKRLELHMGQAPVKLQGTGGIEPSRVVLQADSSGHFITSGQINGKAVQLMVDTGATLVILGQSDADRLGLRAGDGEPMRVTTANGTVLARQVRLATVRIGAAQIHDVPGVVMPQSMPYVLLGNSFLSRFQMQRTNDQMVLDKRF